MKRSLSLIISLLSVIVLDTAAQIKITDNADISIDKNAILQLGSSEKGLLPPYVVLINLEDPSPLEEPVLHGMLVCDTTGTNVTKGYYYWDGSKWVRIRGATLADVGIDPVEVNTSCTLQPDENMVLAKAGEANNYLLQLTLPVISLSDNGLTFIIKHDGSYKDLIIVLPGSGSSINDFYLFPLFRHESVKLIAWNGTWVSYDTPVKSKRDYFVAPTSSWNNIHEAIEFMNIHQSLPIVTFNPLIIIAPGTYVIDSTIVINAGRPITIQGHSYGNVILVPGDSLEGPMFIAETESYFKMLVFDATGNENNVNYGSSPGHDGILLSGEDSTYYEIKDAMFIGFHNAVNITNNVELWFFEADVYDSHHAGLTIDDTSAAGGTFVKLSEVDFINNEIAVYLKKGTNASVSIFNGGYYMEEISQTGIMRNENDFTDIDNIFISGNTWSNEGEFLAGFDFSRQDGRDANVMLSGNNGVADAHPFVKISLDDNQTATSTNYTNNLWYPVSWNAGNFAYLAEKWKAEQNKITYLTDYGSDVVMFISGYLLGSNGGVYQVGVVKNMNGAGGLSASSTVYGKMSIRMPNSSSSTFSTVVYLKDVSVNDHYQLYIRRTSGGTEPVLEDLQWYTEIP